MPFSSSSFTSVASEKRGGGWVKCWSVSSLLSFSTSPSASGGSTPAAASGSVSSSAACSGSCAASTSRCSSGVSS